MLNLKILRWTAWLLLLSTLITLISGFLAQKPFLATWFDSSLALKIHIGLFLFIFILLFYLHSLTGIFNILSRYQKWNKKNIKIIIGVIWTVINLFLVFFILATVPNITQLQPQAVPNSLTVNEVAQHNQPTDCWMIIDNRVYNFTNYLSIHPGNAKTMIPYCGKDGTGGYDTKDRGQSHSAYADSLLSQYYLGELSK